MKNLDNLRDREFKKYFEQEKNTDGLYDREGYMYSAVPERFYEAGFRKAIEIIKQRMNSSLFIDIVSEALHSAYFFGGMDLKELNISENKDDPKYYDYFKRRSKELREDILEILLT